jgi:hypothetical protein
MFKWVKHYLQFSFQTQIFILVNVLFGLCLVVTTIYSYARLDFSKTPYNHQKAEKTHAPPQNTAKAR